MTRPRVSGPRSRLKPRPRPARHSTGGGAKRTALVTGAARGIGAAVTKRLLADGYQVIALDRASDDERLDYAMGTEAELRGLGAQPVVADATDPDALARAIKGVDLDVIVCAAGVIAGGVDAWELELEREQAVIEVNLGGVMTAARIGIPALLRRPEPREGRFIAIASTAATRGLPKLAAYSAAKAGVVGFVKALAVELGGTGITANCVSPGSTRTAILDESARMYRMTAEDFAKQQPLGRLLEPEEIAALVAWLASVQSRGATGGDFPLDGGLAL